MQTTNAEVTTFDSTSEALNSLLGRIKTGQVQLPDFQRGWVWDDEHIRSLIASISRSFPIGAVMLLQTGNPNVRFKPRPVETVKLPEGVEPELLILDGQQRLTSLYQVLFSGKAVKTKDARGYETFRHYYLDIDKVLGDGDREEAIVSIPQNKQMKNFRGEVVADYTTVDQEVAAGYFPLSSLADQSQRDQWMIAYIGRDPSTMADRMSKWSAFGNVLQRILQYQLPVITLRKSNSKEAVCLVFEKVNTGGVPLTVFELLTATFAADDFDLRDDWRKRVERFKQFPILKAITSTEFLQAITLLVTKAGKGAVSCKRKEVLELQTAQYQQWADKATDAAIEVAKFLINQKLFSERELPYRTQLAPLIAIFTQLGPRAQVAAVQQKIAQWFWCGVFGELYGGAIETRFAKDVQDVLAWVENGADVPTTIKDANFAPDRIDRLYTRNSAAYKGLLALLIHDGCHDFRTGTSIDHTNYFSESVDIHHIFPKAWCIKHGIESKVYDSAVNKTPLTYQTNRILGGHAPSTYLASIQRKQEVNAEQLRGFLISHVIDPDLLATDNFQGFYDKRKSELLRRIERAMGKAILPEQKLESEELAPDFQPDDSPETAETTAF